MRWRAKRTNTTPTSCTETGRCPGTPISAVGLRSCEVVEEVKEQLGQLTLLEDGRGARSQRLPCLPQGFFGEPACIRLSRTEPPRHAFDLVLQQCLPWCGRIRTTMLRRHASITHIACSSASRLGKWSGRRDVPVRSRTEKRAIFPKGWNSGSGFLFVPCDVGRALDRLPLPDHVS